MLRGLTIALMAGTAWAAPALNDPCKQVRRSIAAIAKAPILEPAGEAPTLEPTGPAPAQSAPPPLEAPQRDPLEAPQPEPSQREAPSLEAPQPGPSTLELPWPGAHKPQPTNPEPTIAAPAPPKPRAALTLPGARPTTPPGVARPAKRQGSAAVSDEHSALGLLGKDLVQRYIRRSEPKLRYCYERKIGGPAHEGTVKVEFVITPAGAVTSLIPTALGVDTEVADCVAANLQSIEFPRSAAPVQVVYRFHFVTSDD